MQSAALTRHRLPLPAAAAPALSGGLTGYGVILFVVCFCLAGSGMEWMRDALTSQLGGRSSGLSFHPYLLVVAIIFPLVVLQRITLVPRRLIAAFALFSSLTYISTFYGGIAAQELIKISATFLTIITTSLLVRTREDFLAGVVGICLAVAILAVIGLDSTERQIGADIIEGTGRNTFSLFSLPMMLLGGYVLTQVRRVPLTLSLLIAGAIAISMIAMILTLNRSGWLGAGVIALLLIPGGKLRSVLVVGAVIGAVALFFRDPVEVQVVRDRVQKTAEGNQSDELRMSLIRHSAQIAIEAPLLGVSPQHLPLELAWRVGGSKLGISPHNVVAHVAAGNGIPCLLSLIWIGVLLWRWEINPKTSPPVAKRFKAARHLLRMMIILWVVRGMFTHDILYAPAFSMALGICIGMCLRYSTLESRQPVVVGNRRDRYDMPRRRRRLRAAAGLEL